VTRKVIVKIDFILPPVFKMKLFKNLNDEGYPKFPVRTIKKDCYAQKGTKTSFCREKGNSI
jgi:hypothetical protein